MLSPYRFLILYSLVPGPELNKDSVYARPPQERFVVAYMTTSRADNDVLLCSEVPSERFIVFFSTSIRNSRKRKTGNILHTATNQLIPGRSSIDGEVELFFGHNHFLFWFCIASPSQNSKILHSDVIVICKKSLRTTLLGRFSRKDYPSDLTLNHVHTLMRSTVQHHQRVSSLCRRSSPCTSSTIPFCNTPASCCAKISLDPVHRTVNCSLALTCDRVDIETTLTGGTTGEAAHLLPVPFSVVRAMDVGASPSPFHMVVVSVNWQVGVPFTTPNSTSCAAPPTCRLVPSPASRAVGASVHEWRRNAVGILMQLHRKARILTTF
eukprot:gene10154-7109_t